MEALSVVKLPSEEKREVKMPCAMVAMDAKRFVDDAVVAKKLVAVAFERDVLPVTERLGVVELIADEF